MALLDHFHPPLAPSRHWESFHAAWASTIARVLNDDLLPDGYFAEEHTHLGPRIEIDVATFDADSSDRSNGSVATRTYAPPAPTLSISAAFPDEFEVRVYESEGGSRLVAAIELVSPANKDREEHRRAFAAKCAGYLAQGISLIVADVVTNRRANLHLAIMNLMGRSEDAGLPAETDLYAVAYRPQVRDGKQMVDVWAERLAVDSDLPTLPLALNAELTVPIDLEESYTATCSSRRFPV